MVNLFISIKSMRIMKGKNEKKIQVTKEDENWKNEVKVMSITIPYIKLILYLS